MSKDKREAKIDAMLRDSADLALEHTPDRILAECESPIEEMMMLALWARGGWTGRLDFHFYMPLAGLVMEAEASSHTGQVCPQVKIGGYRVDIAIAMGASGGEPVKVYVIECDGHDFHEKTKEQARNDKERDRVLAAHGCTVLRFTGSEIFKDCGACADEVIGLVYSDWVDSCNRNTERIKATFGSIGAWAAARAKGVILQ